MVLVGVLWLEAMHWWVLTPTYPGEVNRYSAHLLADDAAGCAGVRRRGGYRGRFGW